MSFGICLFLTSLSMIISSYTHVGANGILLFFLCCQYSSVCVCVCVCVCACVCMYHIRIHSSVDGHSRCFHVLAVVNSVAVNTGGMYLFAL